LISQYKKENNIPKKPIKPLTSSPEHGLLNM
jgi:hypothetical protein